MSRTGVSIADMDSKARLQDTFAEHEAFILEAEDHSRVLAAP